MNSTDQSGAGRRPGTTVAVASPDGRPVWRCGSGRGSRAPSRSCRARRLPRPVSWSCSAWRTSSRSVAGAEASWTWARRCRWPPGSSSSSRVTRDRQRAGAGDIDPLVDLHHVLGAVGDLLDGCQGVLDVVGVGQLDHRPADDLPRWLVQQLGQRRVDVEDPAVFGDQCQRHRGEGEDPGEAGVGLLAGAGPVLLGGRGVAGGSEAVAVGPAGGLRHRYRPFCWQVTREGAGLRRGQHGSTASAQQVNGRLPTARRGTWSERGLIVLDTRGGPAPPGSAPNRCAPRPGSSDTPAASPCGCHPAVSCCPRSSPAPEPCQPRPDRAATAASPQGPGPAPRSDIRATGQRQALHDASTTSPTRSSAKITSYQRNWLRTAAWRGHEPQLRCDPSRFAKSPSLRRMARVAEGGPDVPVPGPRTRHDAGRCHRTAR